ncbi:MAG TPA: M20/M25/M40 family metallo-hydrolase [Pyrinomonadaceae bacterium]|nr:M20/M25/M40 family metallo-hydrolase [Pyrinomonadaceae bacterium]
MKKNLFAFLLLLALILPSAVPAQVAVKISAGEQKMAAAITQEQLRDYLYFIASDEMEGRDTPSRGLDLTAKFIALQLKKWGVRPAGDNGTYFQKMALRRETIDRANAFMEIGAQRFPYGEEFFRMRGGSMTGALTAPLVFAGDGWFIKSKNIDAYSNVDVRGKIAVVQLQGAATDPSLIIPPKGVSRAELKPEARGTDWIDPFTYAQQKGAAGVVVVASRELQGFWGQARQFLSRSGATRVEGLHDEPKNAGTMPVFLVSQTIGGALYEGEAVNPIISAQPVASFEMNAGKKFAALVTSRTETMTTQNVVAVLEGSDAVLKNEMVAVGAHYDHVGMNPNVPGEDKIFNGADDDGSGTTAVLAIAETLAKQAKKPKRSVLFVWHAGEEKGLWGSEYFVKYPTVDLKNVVAQLNIDMIGRSKKPGYQAPCDINPRPGQKPCNAELTGENEVYVIGSEMMSSDLGAVTKGVNDSFLKMTYNYKYDDPKDENQFFTRSDHYHYAKKGIPIAFWFSGTHEDYHGVGDHADKIDYAKMERITRTIFLTLWELGEAKSRPKVDRQIPAEMMRR